MDIPPFQLPPQPAKTPPEQISSPVSAIPFSAVKSTLDQTATSTTEQQIQKIIAESKGNIAGDPSPEEQERYLRGFSWGALVYSFLYFRAMKDSLYTWLSLIFSLTIFPALIALPFFARRRAWEKGSWYSFSQFQESQQKWDRAALYGGIILLIFSYIFFKESSSLFQSILKQNSTSTDTTQQLKDLQQGVQSLGSDN